MAAVNWQKTKACVNPMMLTRTFLSLFRFYLDFSLVITILEVNYMPCASVWICMTYLRVFKKKCIYTNLGNSSWCTIGKILLNASLEGVVNTAKPKVYNQWLIQELIWALVLMWASPCDVSFAAGRLGEGV